MEKNRPAIIAVAGALILHGRLDGDLANGIITAALAAGDSVPDLARAEREADSG